MISHFARCSRSFKRGAIYFNAPYSVPSQSSEVVSGRVVSKSVSKIVNTKDDFRKLRVSDFSIENLVAVGASMPLAKLPLSPMSAADAVDGAVTVISDVEPQNND